MREFADADHRLLSQRLLKIDSSLDVNAPAGAIWAVVADPATWATWHEDFVEHRAITAQTTGVGTRLASREWWKLRSESEITRWHEGRVVGLTARRATFWRWLVRCQYHEIEIEPAGIDRSTVHFRMAFKGTVLFWVMSAYSVAHAIFGMHLTARSSLKSLKRLVEAEGATSAD